MDLELEIPVPIAVAREDIIKKLLKKFKTSSLTEVELKYISKHTHGFVGADLENLLSKSVVLVNKNGKFVVNLEYSTILQKMSKIKPSAMRELLIEKPDVKWTDIGGQDELKLKLKQIVEWPINHPETFERLGITPPRGLLVSIH